METAGQEGLAMGPGWMAVVGSLHPPTMCQVTLDNAALQSLDKHRVNTRESTKRSYLQTKL